MKVDGRRIQGSTLISRELEELKAEPPLFPSDSEKRVAVEEAERWGDEVLQDVPRRIVRWLSVHRPETKVMIAREVGIPFPRFAAWINTPAAKHLANKVDADGEIQRAIAQVPEVLDHVDQLIADGVIGGEEPERGGLPDRDLRSDAAQRRRPGSCDEGQACRRPGDALRAGVRHRLPGRPAAGRVAHGVRTILSASRLS